LITLENFYNKTVASDTKSASRLYIHFKLLIIFLGITRRGSLPSLWCKDFSIPIAHIYCTYIWSQSRGSLGFELRGSSQVK